MAERHNTEENFSFLNTRLLFRKMKWRVKSWVCDAPSPLGGAFASQPATSMQLPPLQASYPPSNVCRYFLHIPPWVPSKAFPVFLFHAWTEFALQFICFVLVWVIDYNCMTQKDSLENTVTGCPVLCCNYDFVLLLLVWNQARTQGGTMGPLPPPNFGTLKIYPLFPSKGAILTLL